MICLTILSVNNSMKREYELIFEQYKRAKINEKQDEDEIDTSHPSFDPTTTQLDLEDEPAGEGPTVPPSEGGEIEVEYDDGITDLDIDIEDMMDAEGDDEPERELEDDLEFDLSENPEYARDAVISAIDSEYPKISNDPNFHRFIERLDASEPDFGAWSQFKKFGDFLDAWGRQEMAHLTGKKQYKKLNIPGEGEGEGADWDLADQAADAAEEVPTKQQQTSHYYVSPSGKKIPRTTGMGIHGDSYIPGTKDRKLTEAYLSVLNNTQRK
jgi:hypothetical protein